MDGINFFASLTATAPKPHHTAPFTSLLYCSWSCFQASAFTETCTMSFSPLAMAAACHVPHHPIAATAPWPHQNDRWSGARGQARRQWVERPKRLRRGGDGSEGWSNYRQDGPTGQPRCVRQWFMVHCWTTGPIGWSLPSWDPSNLLMNLMRSYCGGRPMSQGCSPTNGLSISHEFTQVVWPKHIGNTPSRVPPSAPSHERGSSPETHLLLWFSASQL